MNIFEIFKDAVGPFADGDKKPLHVGEVMNLWFYLIGTQQTLRVDQIAYNTTQDEELKDKLRDMIENVHQPMIHELQEFFRMEGIPLPTSTPEKVLNEIRDIPHGVRMTDTEIADLMAYNLVIGITAACRGITESVRADVGMMFMKYFTTKVTFALTLKAMMDKRGWLKIPPFYKP